jgi:hypothetical protein
MSKAKEHVYSKLREKLLEANYFSSSLIEKAKTLKQVDEIKFIKQVDEIKDFLLQKMKEGDGVAYSLYYVSHEDVLKKIDELSNFSKVKSYLQDHTDLQSPNDEPYFDPKVVYFAEVLGMHGELWTHDYV